MTRTDSGNSSAPGAKNWYTSLRFRSRKTWIRVVGLGCLAPERTRPAAPVGPGFLRLEIKTESRTGPGEISTAFASTSPSDFLRNLDPGKCGLGNPALIAGCVPRRAVAAQVDVEPAKPRKREIKDAENSGIAYLYRIRVQPPARDKVDDQKEPRWGPACREKVTTCSRSARVANANLTQSCTRSRN